MSIPGEVNTRRYIAREENRCLVASRASSRARNAIPLPLRFIDTLSRGVITLPPFVLAAVCKRNTRLRARRIRRESGGSRDSRFAAGCCAGREER